MDAWKRTWRISVSAAILVLSVLLSVGGVYYAVHVTGCDADAGRGGAIADAISLFLMFLAQSYASRLYRLKARLRERQSKGAAQSVNRTEVLQIVKDDMIWVLDSMDADARIQRAQNILLALATAVGIAFWGFGDMIARSFIGHGCT